MSYEIQSVIEWLEDQTYGWGERRVMSYDGFRFIEQLRKMNEIYDRCDGNYHSKENSE